MRIDGRAGAIVFSVSPPLPALLARRLLSFFDSASPLPHRASNWITASGPGEGGREGGRQAAAAGAEE